MTTLAGLLAVLALVVWAMASGGTVSAFFDPPSLLMVVGGTIAVVYARHPWPEFVAHLHAAADAFRPSTRRLEKLATLLPELGSITRKQVLLALEGEAAATSEAFLRQGLTLLADGTDEARLTAHLRLEMETIYKRNAAVISVWQAWVETAPAMGLVGTLIGLVQMLGNMSDPKAIGPAMALALLTTLYGVVLANVVAAPIVSKLRIASDEELEYLEAVLAGMQMISRNDNPRLIGEAMLARLGAPHASGSTAASGSALVPGASTPAPQNSVDSARHPS